MEVQSTTGVADIDLVLGYNFLNKEKYHAGINLGLTIPCGEENSGDVVWHPIYGNANHWALGVGPKYASHPVFQENWGALLLYCSKEDRNP